MDVVRHHDVAQEVISLLIIAMKCGANEVAQIAPAEMTGAVTLVGPPLQATLETLCIVAIGRFIPGFGMRLTEDVPLLFPPLEQIQWHRVCETPGDKVSASRLIPMRKTPLCLLKSGLVIVRNERQLHV